MLAALGVPEEDPSFLADFPELAIADPSGATDTFRPSELIRAAQEAAEADAANRAKSLQMGLAASGVVR